MKKILKVLCKLLLGFIFCACATVLALKSNLGLSPWDVYNYIRIRIMYTASI